jgi:hypothetical protein
MESGSEDWRRGGRGRLRMNRCGLLGMQHERASFKDGYLMRSLQAEAIAKIWKSFKSLQMKVGDRLHPAFCGFAYTHVDARIGRWLAFCRQRVHCHARETCV